MALPGQIVYPPNQAFNLADLDSVNEFADTTTFNGIKLNVVTKSADYTLTDNDNVVVFTATATATLPAASGSGLTLMIGCTSGFITIDGNGTDTINEELTQTIGAGEAVQLVDYASGKWIVT